MGYRFQFITLAGFHALNASMFELANAYANEGMSAYVRLQEREFELEPLGYSATRHQAEVGTGYFDRVSEVVSRGTASTLALAGSTERAQFAAAGGNGKTGAVAPSASSTATERGSTPQARIGGSESGGGTGPGDGSGVGGSGGGIGPGSGSGVGRRLGLGEGCGSGSGVSERIIAPPAPLAAPSARSDLAGRVARLLHRVGGLLAVPRLDGQAIGVGGRERRASDLVAAREQEDLVAVAGLPGLRPVRSRSSYTTSVKTPSPHTGQRCRSLRSCM